MKIELYYPIKPIFVTQSFGLNLTAFYKQAKMKGHSGIDFRIKHGQPIYATHDGICYPQVDDHGGNGIVLWGEVYYDDVTNETITKEEALKRGYKE